MDVAKKAESRKHLARFHCRQATNADSMTRDEVHDFCFDSDDQHDDFDKPYGSLVPRFYWRFASKHSGCDAERSLDAKQREPCRANQLDTLVRRAIPQIASLETKRLDRIERSEVQFLMYSRSKITCHVSTPHRLHLRLHHTVDRPRDLKTDNLRDVAGRSSH